MKPRTDFNEGYTLTSKELEFRTDDLMSAFIDLNRQVSKLFNRLGKLELMVRDLGKDIEDLNENTK